MANKRMVSKSISVSEQVNELSEFAALLFTWMIPHSDDFGVIPGSSKKIKALVIPMRKQSAEQVEAALCEMQKQGLIWRYIYYDKEYLQFCKFEEHQDGLHKRTTPKNPLYLEVRGDSENFREIPGNSHLREEKGREQKGIGKEKEQEQEQEDERFADFWSEYPKKIAKNEAFKAWNKIKVDEILFMKIIQAIRLQRQSSAWLKDDGAYIPNPATWLNGKRWDDEVKKIKPTGAARFKQVLESGQFEQTGNYSDIDIDFEHIPEAGGG